MSEPVLAAPPRSGFSVRYEPIGQSDPDNTVLAEVVFGAPPSGAALPVHSGFELWARSDLLPERGALAEIWRSAGPVRRGVDGSVRFAEDTTHLFGLIEIDERDAGSIGKASELAYAEIVRFMRDRPHASIVRYWNYFSRINEGLGDDERYRHFCTGRALGLGDFVVEHLPAATAIGRQDDSSILQVYWLAAQRPGQHIENPRQVSAYRYPRRYGPTSPSFSRAHLLPEGRLLISGTASVVGHESHHVGDLPAQFRETDSNLTSLIQAARCFSDRLPARFGGGGLLKVYLRDHNDLAQTVDLMSRFPETPWIILGGDICRADLLIEIDGIHGPTQP
ncbi:MAG: pteridine-dependent deoxygenase [Ahniella sp.]|nr:pteridine-dependent deoxygenase [Ahniella sp.]